MSRSRLRTALLLSAVLLAGVGLFAGGMYVAARQAFPYSQLQSLKHRLEGRPAPTVDATDAPAAEPDFSGNSVVERRFRRQLPSLMHITEKGSIGATRERLARFIWNAPLAEGWHRRAAIRRNIHLTGSPSAASATDRLTVRLPWGVTSVAYLFHPRGKPSGQLVIYHQGHEPAALPTKQLSFFLRRGHAVLSMQMPLTGRNNRPTTQGRFGPIRLRGHADLALLPTRDHHPIGLFFEPLRVAVNTLAPRYRRISLVGLSGGGWATTVYAAVDPRITASYPVAGTLPFPLRYQQPVGDWEQTLPALYEIADYLDLYVLGSAGRDRSQLQLLNETDPCCFAGRGYRLYEPAVAARVRALGAGRFAVSPYRATQHAVTTAALEAIDDDMSP